MQKFRPSIPAALLFAVVALFFLGIWLGVKVPGWLGLTGTQRVYGSATVLQQVQTLSQLVTVKYVMEKIVVLEDVKWFGESRVLLVAHGIVKAGVDFNRLKPDDIKVSGKKISILLPPVEITDTYLDDKQTRVVERTTGLLRTFDKDLEQTARQNAVADLKIAARSAGIMKDAQERAEAQVKSLFRQMGYEEVEFIPR